MVEGLAGPTSGRSPSATMHGRGASGLPKVLMCRAVAGVRTGRLVALVQAEEAVKVAAPAALTMATGWTWCIR